MGPSRGLHSSAGKGLLCHRQGSHPVNCGSPHAGLRKRLNAEPARGVEESCPSPRKPCGACGEPVPVALSRTGKAAGLQRKPGGHPVLTDTEYICISAFHLPSLSHKICVFSC